MKANEIAAAIEKTAPLHWQEEYDNSGWQAGCPDTEIDTVMLALDPSQEVIDEAIRCGAGMVVTHHPLIFKPLRHLCGMSWQERCVEKALKAGLCIYAAHTNLDNAPGGVNARIASVIGLEGTEPLVPMTEGAGSGLIGSLRNPVSAEELLKMLGKNFGADGLRHSSLPYRKLQRIALCGGAGAFLMKDARAKNADCYITGEFHYHDWFDSEGLFMVELGHWQSEQFTVDLLEDILKAALPSLKIVRYGESTNPVRYFSR
ncbi:MAG: Nif3-like dinuclear metal center hexameric protein [Bacteroidales bacterium]|nr:Nif3-like dinuclear metal center hexameric protein [Bacteroidales bacterium]